MGYIILLSLLEPHHERGRRNLAFFESLQLENPDKFVDAEVESKGAGSGRLDSSETALYEATCREGKPLVNYLAIANCLVCHHDHEFKYWWSTFLVTLDLMVSPIHPLFVFTFAARLSAPQTDLLLFWQQAQPSPHTPASQNRSGVPWPQDICYQRPIKWCWVGETEGTSSTQG